MADQKYQKQENKTNNLNGNTNNRSKHNNNDKSNNFVGNNNKNSYEKEKPKSFNSKTCLIIELEYEVLISLHVRSGQNFWTYF